jgi:hypothetical protein
MKNIFLRSAISLSKIQKSHIQLLIAVLMIAMLVLGAGAPTDGGGTLIPH